jgi:hypothetical protein
MEKLSGLKKSPAALVLSGQSVIRFMRSLRHIKTRRPNKSEEDLVGHLFIRFIRSLNQNSELLFTFICGH